MTGHYFEGNHPELESRLESHLKRMGESFEDAGWRGALVLGGGYGRGEGGVMSGPDGEGFSNDLDYFLFEDAPHDARLGLWCRQIEREESEVMGIDVEIKCLRADSLGEVSRSMMFADLVAGHVVVAGDGRFLNELRAGLDFARVAPEEATRLLWNRGTGLFFARCRIGRHEEMKFVLRNHAKVKLALGDAWLCVHGQYTSRCRDRAVRLGEIDLPEELVPLRDWHAQGVAFKFSPVSGGMTWGELDEESRRLVDVWGDLYLRVEGKRLGRRLAGFTEYVGLARLLPATSLVRNLALAARDRLMRGACIRPLGDYPRAGLMRALPCLLGLVEGGASQAGRFLPGCGGDVSLARTWEETYTKWWAHYA